jgi:hypothetical protein
MYFLLFPIRAMCPAHKIVLDLLTFIMSDIKHKSWNSSACIFLHPPVTSVAYLRILFAASVSLALNVRSVDPIYSHDYHS